jgi:Glycosyl transferase family 2
MSAGAESPESGSDPPELAFVLAPRQNLFFHELVEALRDEAQAAGARTSLHIGNFPAPRPDLIYVLVPPHEYFTLMHGRIGPPPQALRRTIFICAEQPSTSFFDANVALAARAGAVFDINRSAVAEFAAAGIAARHLQIGWTPGWDHFGERERDIDVLFIGGLSQRRAVALSRYAATLWRRRVCYVIADNSLPNWMASESFRAGEDKWDLLARAKIVLNIHQGDTAYFEWLRVAQAIASGAVVVSEHSMDLAPLVPGHHLLTGEIDSLALLAQLHLDDDDRRGAIQAEAYRFLREQLPLAGAVADLLRCASRLAQTEALPESDDAFFTQPQPDPDEIAIFAEPTRVPSQPGEEPATASLRRGVKQMLLELSQLRRQLTETQLELRSGRPVARIELVARTRAHPAARPRVSVLVALYNYEDHVIGALESLRRSQIGEWELIVVDDGSGDRSLERVKAWIAGHEDVAALLLRHPVNQGLGPTRNDALDWARGEFCFVLDADNEIYPHCLARLIEALERDGGAAFAYGIQERFTAGEPSGLQNVLAWEPRRLRVGNYIDAMAMIRTRVLREEFDGYARDGRLHGLEDYDLWCRLADRGHRGALVPEILARYRTNSHSMQSLTNISGTEALSLVIERSPRLMAGMAPPL